MGTQIQVTLNATASLFPSLFSSHSLPCTIWIDQFSVGLLCHREITPGDIRLTETIPLYAAETWISEIALCICTTTTRPTEDLSWC